MKSFTIYTDGAARGNPGPAGAGWVILDAHGKLLVENKKYLGELTNNQAEYQALLLALNEMQKMGTGSLVLCSDSELMVRQLKGEYKVKNEGLKPLFREAVLILSRFEGHHLKHIPREQNGEADRLANEAIDGHFGQ
ncbi:MAG: ribonuclease HI family protein [Deltaproteobacteria bacterium]|nr:ribonuclease HI family protein [Deltaproteobacteria bacterium]